MVHESLKKVAALMQIPEEMVGIKGAPPVKPKELAPVSEKLDPMRVLELDLLRWLIIYGAEKKEFISTAKQFLTPHHFFHPICQKIYSSYFEQLNRMRSLISSP